MSEEPGGRSVLIVGCGDLGTEAALRYVAAGHRVTGWRRNPAVLPSAIAGVAADIARPPLPKAPADTDILVIAVAADASSEEAYRRAYLGGVRHTLDALDRDGVRPSRALFVSSTAVYGARAGDVDESTPAVPDGFNGAVMLEAEGEFLRRIPAGIVLRLGGIYGPGRTRLIGQVRAGEARTSSRRTARIHRDDAAAAIVHLTTTASASGGIYLGVDDDAAIQADVVRFLANELGVPAPTERMQPSARGADRAVSNAKLSATGWRPRYPTYVEGYRSILRGEGTRHP
jgi:nucleoside-diphosphate-sugar epimerase